jgi:IS605 OrfB family transposase
VYNKTVEEIYKKKHVVKFELLRDKLVTANTKKYNEEYTKATEEIKRLYMLRNKYKETMKLFMRTRRGSLNIMKIKQAIANIDENVAKERAKQKVLPVEKNMGIREWELRTPKEVRAGAVDDVCKAIKTGYANIKNGNIKHFRLKFRKRTEPNKCILVPKSFVKNNNGSIQIAPQFFKENCIFKMGNRTKKKHGDIQINNDARIVRQRKEYWIIIPVPVVIQNKKLPNTYCGVDPGVRTFMTLFGKDSIVEYKHSNEIMKKLDTKIKILKDKRVNGNNRIRKERITRLESRKDNLINELHWKTITHIVRNNDFIFYGNINSHNIVRNGKNRTLNRDVNNLKFYKFKERLLYKAQQYGNKVYLVNEAHTSKTCSSCGCITEVGSSKIYTCCGCKRVIDRDINSGKNILMKGIITNE